MSERLGGWWSDSDIKREHWEIERGSIVRGACAGTCAELFLRFVDQCSHNFPRKLEMKPDARLIWTLPRCRAPRFFSLMPPDALSDQSVPKHQARRAVLDVTFTQRKNYGPLSLLSAECQHAAAQAVRSRKGKVVSSAADLRQLYSSLLKRYIRMHTPPRSRTPTLLRIFADAKSTQRRRRGDCP